MTGFHSFVRSVVCVFTGAVMLIGMASVASAARPRARLDFDTPMQQQKLLADEPTAIAALSAPELSPRHAVVVGQGLTIERAPERLAAGERWAIVRAKVNVQPVPASAVLEAAVFAIGGDKPLVTLKSEVKHERVWFWIDLRSEALGGESAARVVLTLTDGAQRVGAAELSIAADAAMTAMPRGSRVEVKIDCPPGLQFADETMPVTFGFPVPEGALWEADDLRVVDEAGRALPFQREVTGRWNHDGAVQWVRFDAIAPARATRVFVERATDAKSPPPAVPVRVREAGGRVTVDVAGLTYVLGAAHSPIQEIRRGDKVLATGTGARGLYVVDQTGRVATASDAQASVTVEAQGDVTASVRIEGPMVTSTGETLARHITRLEFFAGQPTAKITHTLVLVNDTNEVWFKDVGWAMKTAVGSNGTDAAAVFNVSRDDPQKVLSVPLSGATTAWMLQDRHVRYQAGENHFAVASDVPGGAVTNLTEGAECGDWSALTGGAGTLVIACREAARQHPKEFAFTADGFDLKLFSNRGGEELDFRVPTRMEIWNISKWLDTGINAKARPGGEDRIRQIPSNAVGWSKTHELSIGILPADAGVPALSGVSRLNSEGVFAAADPQCVYASRVFGPLYPKDEARFADAERLIDQTVDWWITRGEHVGEWGFVDAFSGPHMAYRGSAGMPMMRRFPLTYTLRRDLWMLYARSGDRDIRRANADSLRTFMDGCMARWDGDGKTKGLYLTEGDGAKWSQTSTPESVPMYWQGQPKLEISTTSDLNDFYWFYQLTGYRRAKEAITDYAEAVRKTWTPTVNRKQYRQMRLLLTLSQCYAYTGDETFRIMAEDMSGVLWEPEGAIRVRREKAYGASYKMQSDTTCVDFAWRYLRDPRLREMNDAVMAHFVNEFLGQHPFQYSYPMGLVAVDRFEATSDPSLAAGALISTRLATSTYDPEKALFGRLGMFAPAMRGIFEGLPYHMHLIARTDADRQAVASWAAFEIPEDGSASVLVQKSARQNLTVRIVNDRYFAPPGEIKPGPTLRLLAAAKGERPSQWMLESNEVRIGESKTATATIAFDAPAGTYELSNLLPGLNTVIVDAAAPLVVQAPSGLRTSPSVRRVFFKLPDNAAGAGIKLEQPAVILTPDGKPFGDGKPVQGEVELPAVAGVWTVNLTTANLIQLTNAPGVFGFNEASLFLDPPVAATGPAADEAE